MDPIATLIIIFAAIFIVFLNEFTATFHKIISIPGIKLWGPLLLISWYEEKYYSFVRYLFLWLRACLTQFIDYLSIVWSSPHSHIITQIIFLYVLGMMPVLFLEWRAHFKFGHQFVRRKIVKKHPVAYRIYIIVWIIISILVVVRT